MEKPKKRDGKPAKWPADWPQPKRFDGAFGINRSFPLTTKELAAWLASKGPCKQMEMF